jgi:biotin carboxyl carrier protein
MEAKKMMVSVDGGTAVEIQYNGDIDLRQKVDGHYSLIYNSNSFDVELISVDLESKELVLSLDGLEHICHIQTPLDITIQEMGLLSAQGTKLKEIKAPMPGKVLQILVNNGDEVKSGESLLILEAMKMENVIKAPHDLTVKDIKVKLNQAVEKEAVLLKL